MVERSCATILAKNTTIPTIIIWLNHHFDINDSTTQHSFARLRNIYRHVEIFIDTDACVDFVTSLNDNDECIVIMNGSLSEHIISLIHSLLCVKTIYILALSGEQLKCADYAKFHGEYSNIQSLCDRLCLSSYRLHEPIPFDTFPPISSSESTNHRETKQEALFMYGQLVRDILLQINENRDEAKNEMLEECRQLYVNNDSQLRHVDELERDYTEERAVWWFTKDTFLYRILNDALRKQNIAVLYKLRLLIKDLDRQLKNLHDAATITSFTVYRGQGMSQDEFRTKLLNNVGGLLSFNAFMSTSLNRNVSDIFVVRDPLVTSVLFEMEIDSQKNTTHAFADIHRLSAVSEENEVLFSMGAVFRILSVEQAIDGVWHVHVRLTSDGDKELVELREHMRKQIWHPRERLQLGKLILEMGDFRRAENFYKAMLSDSKFIHNDSQLSALLHSDLGAIYGHFGQYSDCLNEYKHAITISEQHHPPNNLLIASTRCNMSATLFLLGKYDQALDECEKAIAIEQSTGEARPLRLASYFVQMGEILVVKDEIREGLNYYERARDIRLEYLPSNHSDLASINSKMASVYSFEDKFTDAYKCCQAALTIQLASLPPDHIELSETYGILGNIAYGQSQYDEARRQQECALAILKKNLPTNHLLTAHMYVSLAMTFLALKELNLAKLHTTQALDIYRAILPPEHLDIKQTQALLCVIQSEQ